MKISMRKILFLLFLMCTFCLCLTVCAGAEGNEAKIGDTEYATLTDALNAAGNGDTVTLLQDVTLPATVTVSKSITIDGNNHTITAGSLTKADDYLFITADGAAFSLKDVTLTQSGTRILKVDAGTSATLESGTHLNLQGDIAIFIVANSTVTMKNGSSVTVTGIKNKTTRGIVNYGVLHCYGKITNTGNHTGEVTAITNYGGSSNAGTVTNIYDGAEILSTNSGTNLISTYAIWSFCPVNVYGGTITGTSGALYLQTHISGGKVKSKADATVTGGTLCSEKTGAANRGAIQIVGDGITVTVKGNATVQNMSTSDSHAGIWVAGAGATINISENATVEGRCGLFINAVGTAASPTTLNMTGGNLYSRVNGGSVLRVQKANATDSDGNVTATYDLYVNLNFSGGNFGPNPTVAGSNNGKINVNGINFGNSNSTVANIDISGGVFTSVNTVFCNAAGKEVHVKLSGDAVLHDGGRPSSNDAVFKISGANNTFTLEMTGGHVDAGVYGIYVAGSTSTADITVTGGTITGDRGIHVSGENAKVSVNISDGELSGEQNAIYVDAAGAALTFTGTGGAVRATGTKNNAIELNKAASANMVITGGEYTATRFGIWVVRGGGVTAQMNISGGNFKTFDTCVRISGKGSRVTITGGSFNCLGNGTADKAPDMGDSAVEILSDANSAGSVMNIYGGTFTAGKSSVARAWYDATLNIYGGSFLFHTFENFSAGTYANTIRAGASSGNGTVYVYGGYFESDNVFGAQVYPALAGSTAVVTGGVFAGGLCPLDSHVSTTGKSTPSIHYPYGLNRTTLNGAVLREGASVRMVEGSCGLRFITDISPETLAYLKSLADEGSEISFGTLIVPTSYLSHVAAFTLAELNAAGLSYLDIAAADGLIPTPEGGYTVRAAIVSILPQNISRSFSAVCYAKYTVDGNTVYAYADFREEATSRSIRNVAKAALADVSATQSGAYLYPLEDGGYSKYSEAQRAVLTGFYNPATESSREIDVYLIAGQSNAAGSSRFNEEFTASNPAFSAGYPNIYYSGTGATNHNGFRCTYAVDFAPLTVGLGRCTTRIGAELGMAQMFSSIYNAESGREAAIVKYAVGGSSLSDVLSGNNALEGNWAPPSYLAAHGAVSERSGGLYRNFLAQVARSLSYLTARGYTVNIKGLYWMQGESDYKLTGALDRYEELLSCLVTDFRADLGTLSGTDLSQMPVFIGEISFTSGMAHSDIGNRFIALQQGFAAKTDNVYTIGSGILGVNAVDTDIYHWTSDDMYLIGQMVGTEMLNRIKGTSFEEPAKTGTPVAQVLDAAGNVIGHYSSLSYAIAVAPEGGCVKLLSDVTLYGALNVSNKNAVTLDGNGKTITSYESVCAILAVGCNLTVQNLNLVHAGEHLIDAYEAPKISISGNVTGSVTIGGTATDLTGVDLSRVNSLTSEEQ